MIKLRIDELLKENKKSKYFLVKELNTNYTVINKMLETKTTGINFDTIDKLCKLFQCYPGDLFKYEEE